MEVMQHCLPRYWYIHCLYSVRRRGIRELLRGCCWHPLYLLLASTVFTDYRGIHCLYSKVFTDSANRSGGSALAHSARTQARSLDKTALQV
jgi:hypothetical protein